MALRIEDYALIGDCKTAALVGRDGSIDWLCWPRFDSAACFAALLGKPDNGRWLIAPKDSQLTTSRRYRPGTLVLETEFRTETGTATVIDFMLPGDGADLVRIVVGQSGRVVFKTELVVRFNYGATVPWVDRLEEGSVSAIAGPERLLLRTPVALYGEDFRTVGEFAVEAGQSIPFALSYGASFQSPPPAIDALDALTRTEAFWRKWSDRCPDVGPWTEAVKRSLITLKALTYAPTGGIVAAATTSLPERLGGVRNWDYRYCWLRDATFTLLAFMSSRLQRRGAGISRLAYSSCRRQPEPSPDHVRRGRRALAAGADRPLAARIRELEAGADRQRGVAATAARRLRRDRGRDVSGTESGHGAIATGTSAAAGRIGLSGAGMAATGRRHLGGARRPPAFRSFEGHGLGCIRSRGG